MLDEYYINKWGNLYLQWSWNCTDKVYGDIEEWSMNENDNTIKKNNYNFTIPYIYQPELLLLPDSHISSCLKK